MLMQQSAIVVVRDGKFAGIVKSMHIFRIPKVTFNCCQLIGVDADASSDSLCVCAREKEREIMMHRIKQ